MFGDTLSFKTCDGLIKKLTRCKNPFECAHGRPTMVPLCNIDEISSVACTGGGVG
jgi:DNA mismatch repair protein MLH3